MNGGSLAGPSDRAGQASGLGPARQELVVVAETDTSTTGILYAMAAVDDGWRTAFGPVEVVFGRAGVGPKREGDGRSPQGRFALGDVFGYAPSPPPGLRMGYLPQPPEAVCVDDPRSSLYNTLVERGEAEDRFDSSEPMRRDLAFGDGLYEWGVWVRYNPEGRRDPETDQGLGSCIFLHVWRSPDSPTAGCTAMDRDHLLQLLAWLDPSASPVLVQGTREHLDGLRRDGLLDYEVPTGQDLRSPRIRPLR